MKLAKKIWTYCLVIVLASVAALTYHLLVFPNRFAPAGIAGICTMIQYVLGINVGYLNLLVNVPIVVAVFILVGKTLAKRSLLYVIVFSTMLIVLEKLDLSRFAYETANGTSRILGPMVAGVINGSCYALLIRSSATTGGTDLISAIIHRFHPEQNLFWIGFSLNSIVAIVSYFVYGYQIEPVILCILYCFMVSTVSDRIIKSGNSAIRCEIITDQPEALSRKIIETLHHTATVMPARGMYRNRETSVVVCVINRVQREVLADIIRDFPNTFADFSEATKVVGNFKKIDRSGKQEKDLLDKGDGIAVS